MSNQITVSRVQLVGALRAGRTAALAGEPVTVCPHRVTGGADERLMAAAWVRAYVRASRR